MIYTGNINDIIKAMEHIKVDYNISNNDIAEKMGKSKQTVSNIFKGRQPNMTLDTLLSLCEAMGCELRIEIERKGE